MSEHTDDTSLPIDEHALPVDFSSFIVSLGSSAMVHLGEAKDPASGEAKPNLQLARQTVDLLQLLKEKTAGNLDDNETRLLDTLLYEIRTKYLAASQNNAG